MNFDKNAKMRKRQNFKKLRKMRKWKIPSFGQFEQNKQKGRQNWIISKLIIAKNQRGKNS